MDIGIFMLDLGIGVVAGYLANIFISKLFLLAKPTKNVFWFAPLVVMVTERILSDYSSLSLLGSVLMGFVVALFFIFFCLWRKEVRRADKVAANIASGFATMMKPGWRLKRMQKFINEITPPLSEREARELWFCLAKKDSSVDQRRACEEKEWFWKVEPIFDLFNTDYECEDAAFRLDFYLEISDLLRERFPVVYEKVIGHQ